MPESQQSSIPQHRFSIEGGDYIEILFNTDRLVVGVDGEDGVVLLRWDVVDGELHFTHSDTDGDVEMTQL